MSGDVEGVEELVRKLRALGVGADDALGDALMAGARIYEGFVKTSMNASKHGRTYGRTKTVTRGVYAKVTDFDGSTFRSRVGSKQVQVRKTHVASAPGEAPAIDYGQLINSIGVEREGNDAVIFTSAEAGPHLEFGTARMQARPFMRPPKDEHEGEIMAAVNKTLARRIQELATK